MQPDFYILPILSSDDFQCLDRCQASKLLLSLAYDHERRNNDRRDGGCHGADRLRSEIYSPDVPCSYERECV